MSGQGFRTGFKIRMGCGFLAAEEGRNDHNRQDAGDKDGLEKDRITETLGNSQTSHRAEGISQ